MRPRLSLRGRGVQLLSQREHSRQELRRKLLQHLRADDAPSTGPSADEAADPAPADAEQQVDDVLAWLQDKGYFSEQRFVESRVHVRESRYGNLRIRQELAQHGLTLDAEQAQRLKETELSRAHEVWVRKFGAAASDPAGRAKQQRFLASRGFSAEVIRRVVKGDVDEAA